MRRTVALILSGVLAAGMGTGCASKYGEQKTDVAYFPACYAPIQDLRDHEHDVAKTTIGAAAVGALAGALVGLIASDGHGSGALLGALGGGLLGGVGGNVWATKSQERDDNKRLASYLQDIDGDISNLDAAGAAARASLQCYDRQFELLLKEIRAKKISRAQAEKEFAEISSGRQEAIDILGNAITTGTDLNQQYEEALANEQALLTATTQPQAQGQRAPRRRAPTQTAQRSQGQINQAKKKTGSLQAATATLSKDKAEAERITAAQLNEIQQGLEDLRS